MDIKILQKEISEFYTEYNVATAGKAENKEVSFAHLVEEVGELARQYVSKDQRPGKYDEKEIEDALADILINVLYLASLFNVDIDKSVGEVLEKDKKHLKGIEKS